MKDDIAYILSDTLEAVERGEITPRQAIARHPEHRAELMDLLSLTFAIRNLQEIKPRPGFRYTARARILRQIADRQQKEQGGRLKRVFNFSFPRLLLRPAFSLAIVIVLLVATLSAGTAYAAASALPGDSLYAVKTGMEDARLALSGPEADAALYLQFADERLDEINALIARGRYDGVSLAAQRFESHIAAVSQLKDRLPDQVAEQLEDEVVQLGQEAEFTHQVLQALADDQNLPVRARQSIAVALERSNQGRLRLQQMFPAGFPPGPPDHVTPGPPEGAGPPDNSGAPEGVGPDKTPGPPDGKGPDKEKPERPAGPSKENPKGPPDDPRPPSDVETGPPQDKDKPEEPAKGPASKQPNNKP